MLPLCHWDRVTRGRVGVGEAWGGCSRDGLVYCQRVVRSGSQDIGLSVRDVEHFVCHVVLIHPDCEAEPGFRVRIQRPSICHFRKGHQDSVVEASAELDHDSFWGSVSGIINQIPELVKVIVDCPLALKIGGHLQDVNGSSF